jgi:hypothetical protein
VATVSAVATVPTSVDVLSTAGISNVFCILAVNVVPAIAGFYTVGKRVTQLDLATRKVAPCLTKSWLSALGPRFLGR